MAAANVVEFTDANFENEVVENNQLTLVDFWAPWCNPCKMLAPTIDKLADEFAGQVKVGKLNTDNNPKVATAHGISSIPTILMFKGGTIVDKFVGVVPAERLSSSIKAHM